MSATFFTLSNGAKRRKTSHNSTSQICVQAGSATEAGPTPTLPNPLSDARTPGWDSDVAACMAEHTTEMEENILINIELSDADALMERADEYIAANLDDFPEEDANDSLAQFATKMARNSITDSTRSSHVRIIKAFIIFHLRRNRNWDPRQINEDTPRDVTLYIAQKCGPMTEGYEGRKFSTAVSTRAALTLWYRSLRPHESLNEWRLDEGSNTWRGLPTRSPFVSRFMLGLEKTKAKAGEISHSARAMRLEDMHRLYEQCIKKPSDTLKAAKSARDRAGAMQEQRAGVVRYAAYLIAWLMLLRVDEVVNLEFENIEHIPAERKYFDVKPKTRKTAQTGVGHGWRLHANDSDPRICPMRALIRLAMVYKSSGIQWSGPMFLQVAASGAIQQDRPLTSSVLSRALSRDLQNLGYSTWALYGTHSFRRGGCQYRVEVQKWPIARVATWGGWSLLEATTMFRYFYSPDDNHELMYDYDRNY
ncbi:hypothetical protein MIND_00202500 [Mycena indigotica]|uniref:Tyr recombinase domain-containing protein n=1 Tax=Mycena indigotica TaxID=2126181 RepID=A0A8H6WCY2_9AGAR|nr:uncharacterized protein MIND_00202500 [Mycena indigotica]KAF7311911.1 hypothetical protein MIND_00202500 [Mycena indigotica]